MTFSVKHGFDSATSVHDTAEQTKGMDRPLIALYVGDWDPSGALTRDDNGRHMDHAAQENGRLKVTWLDFEKFGVRRVYIHQALGELVAVGLIAVEDPGQRIVWGQCRGEPAQYRLTFMPVSEPNNFRPPTNEWKRFEEDVKAAEVAIKMAKVNRLRTPNGKAKGKWKAVALVQ